MLNGRQVRKKEDYTSSLKDRQNTTTHRTANLAGSLSSTTSIGQWQAHMTGPIITIGYDGIKLGQGTRI